MTWSSVAKSSITEVTRPRPFKTQATSIRVNTGGKSGGGDTKAEAKGAGTQTDPYNVAGVLKFIDGLGADKNSDVEVYIKGKVKEVTEQFGTQFGNATFTMIDEGFTASFLAYRVLYLGNVKYTEGDQLKAGDEVIVCGKVVNFRGNTPETVQGNAYLYSLNGKTSGGGGSDTPSGDPKGSGTQADPYNVVAIAQLAAKLADKEVSTQDYYFKGKICSVKYTFSAQYGTATFNVSDDGKTGGTEFTAYSVYTFGNQPWVDGNTQVAVGDEVIICGKITNYGGTLETASKQAYIYSLNGKTENTESGSGGGEGNSDAADITVTMQSFGLDNAGEMGTQTLSDGTKLIFSGEANENTPKYYTSGAAARLYAQNSVTISAEKNITKVVLTCVSNYLGNDQLYGEADSKKVSVSKDGTDVIFSEFSSKTLKIVNDYTEPKAGTQLRIVSIAITYAK